MVGSHMDNIIADAIVKNITGFDLNTAYSAIQKDAFTPPPPGITGGRCGLNSYISLGYVASDAGCSEETSRTLNYMLSDVAVAGAADKLGHASDATLLRARAANYTLIFEPKTGFFRTRDSSGAYLEPFDEFRWGSPYTEAGPWQYRFEVPYDPVGLSKLFEANGFDMCNLLQTSQTMPGTYHTGAYGGVIHEQTEMATLCWGQWELNNQPVWALQWMFTASQASMTTPCSANGQYWLRKSVQELYIPGPDMYTGDEDNGSMSAWYILSSLGLYSLVQGDGTYILGSPLFANVTIKIDNAAIPLTISAKNQDVKNVYVQSVTLNGVPITGTSVQYYDLMQGGILEFTMGPAPAYEKTKPIVKPSTSKSSSPLKPHAGNEVSARKPLPQDLPTSSSSSSIHLRGGVEESTWALPRRPIPEAAGVRGL
jgi:predicted alpha-1,2-mannosidase